MNARTQGFTLVDLMITIMIAGLLAAVAVPAYSGAVQRARVAAAISDMGQIQLELDKFCLRNDNVLPPGLAAVGMDTLTDSWGNPYQYLNIAAGVNRGAVQKNRNLVPLNRESELRSGRPAAVRARSKLTPAVADKRRWRPRTTL